MSGLRRKSSRLALVVTVLLAGCGPAVSESRVAAFSEALGRTTTGVQTSFQVVEEAYLAAKLDGLVADYARNARPDPRVARFLPAPDLAARLEVLRGFEAYAVRLAEVSGGKQFEALEKNTAELGQTLKGFKAGNFKVKDVLGDRGDGRAWGALLPPPLTVSRGGPTGSTALRLGPTVPCGIAGGREP